MYQRDLFALDKCAIRVGPYPSVELVWFLSPQRGSIFIVPSGCMIMTIAGSTTAAGISGWQASPTWIPALPLDNEGTDRDAFRTVGDGDAVSMTTVIAMRS
jgi:hypothetical protein